MSDFSFSYSVTPAGTAPQENKELFSFNGVAFLPGPSETVILHKESNDARMISESGLAHALRQCGQFRSLDDHASAIMQAIPAMRETPEDVSSVLEAVRQAGLFESSAQAWSRLAEADSGFRARPAPARLFIITCDRPAALSRLLTSLGNQSLPEGVEGIWVVDDSRDAANITENGSLIEKANTEFNTPIRHFDMKQREALIEQLHHDLPEHIEEINFLLERTEWTDQPTFGLGRNLVLLLSVGTRAVVLDDDVVLEAVMPPVSTLPLQAGDANDRQATFYDSLEDLNRHALPSQSSPVNMMLEHLGQTLSSVLLSELGGHRALQGWDGQAISRLTSRSSVLITQCGSWGDPGTGDGSWVFNLDKTSIERLLGAGNDLEETLGRRASWFGYRGPTLTAYGTISQMTGIDHSQLLPPYLPAGRGEDILFGVLALRMHPTSAVYNEGWAIRHEPVEDRQDRGALTPIASQTSIGTLVDWLGREPTDQWGLTPRRRLFGVAEQIQRLSEMEQAPLLKLLRHENLSSAGIQLTRCFYHIEQVDGLSHLAGHDDWVRFLEISKNQLLEQIQTPERQRPEPTGDIAALQQQGQRLAAALRAWPTVCEVARRRDFGR